MLERDVIVTIPVDRHVLLVAEVRVLAGSPLVGEPLRRADRPFGTRVIGLTAAGSQRLDWTPDLEHRLVSGDKILVVARRAGLRGLTELAVPPPLILPEGELA
jgi:Trk K+ transport system NAD-binding subunit